MTRERTENEVIIRLPSTIDIEDLQDVVNYARYKEITSGYKISQLEVDKIANDLNSDWWKNNQDRFKVI